MALALGKLVSEANGQHASQYQDVNVAEMAEASGVTIEELEHLAAIWLQVEKPVAVAGNALAGQHNAVTGIAAVQMLNVISGRIGVPGGVSLPAWPSDPFLAPAMPSTFAQVQELVDRLQSGQVQVLLIHGANPIFELPPGVGLVQALENVPLVVYFGSTVDETAAYADLILPDHTSLESWGYHVPISADRPVVSGQQPVMRALYDTRSTVDVLLALAQRLGGTARQAMPWDNEADFIEQAIGSLGITWADWRRQGGWWADQPSQETPVVNQVQLPRMLPVFEGDREPFNLHLLIYPSVALGDGRGANKAWLQETPDPMTTVAWQTAVEINPQTALQLGLEDNDVVRILSPAGEIEGIVYRYHGLPADVVAVAVGRGHEQYGRFAKDFGSNPLKLLVPAAVEATGALAWGATRVRLEKTGRTHTLPRLESPEGVEYLRTGGEH